MPRNPLYPQDDEPTFEQRWNGLPVEQPTWQEIEAQQNLAARGEPVPLARDAFQAKPAGRPKLTPVEGNPFSESPLNPVNIYNNIRNSKRSPAGMAFDLATDNFIVNSIKSGVTLPRDVISGEVPLRDAEGNFNPTIVERGLDTAGLAAGGAFATRPGTATLGSGPVRKPLMIREANAEVGHEGLQALTKPDHFYRAMTEEEFNATVGAGKGIKSNQSHSVTNEGTSFALDAPTAESYANFGRTDPRKTNKPTYLVEVSGQDGLVKTRDGYLKAAEEIPHNRITNIIRMDPENGAIVGTPVLKPVDFKSFSQRWEESGVRNFIADRPSRNEIQLSDLVVQKDQQGKGIGTKYMNELTSMADENGRTITLTPGQRDPHYGTTSQSRLKKFYKEFGFVENKGRNKDYTISDTMYRKPILKADSSTPAKQYPLANRNEWYGEANFEQTGGRMTTMTPDEFLKQSRPLKVDEVSRENIDILKQHIQDGKTLDPLQLYKNNKEDGRHRAIAAKELGIEQVPVINFRDDKKGPFLKADTSETGAAIAAAKSLQKTPRFYSAVENAVVNNPQARATGDQWLATIQNARGVKPEELDWIGLREFLQEHKGKPVTREQVQEHINNNRVEIKEVQNFNVTPQMEAQLRKEFVAANPKPVVDRSYGSLADHPAVKDYMKREKEYVDEKLKGTSLPKYKDYQLPGGENYREMLLTLPKKRNELEAAEMRYKEIWNEYSNNGQKISPERQAEWDALDVKIKKLRNEKLDETSGNLNYTSSHWSEPNVLAHVRMNDRSIDGKKSLHLEEIQSDWHQAGRDKGYLPKGRGQAKATGWENTGPVGSGREVPDAPFKKTWHELALKRMLREAAERGYERLSWTPGDIHPTNPKNLPGAGPGFNPRAEAGMQKFYDEILPKSLEKIGKEWGVKVQKGKAADSSSVYQYFNEKTGTMHDRKFKTEAEAAEWAKKNTLLPGWKLLQTNKRAGFDQPAHDVFYIDIPPQMRETINTRGMPLFAGGLPFIFVPVDYDPWANKK